MNRQQRLRWALLTTPRKSVSRPSVAVQPLTGTWAATCGRKCDDIELIFRDSSHVEQFIDNHLKAETADQELAEWLMEGDQ